MKEVETRIKRSHLGIKLRAFTQKAAHLLTVPIEEIIHCFTQLKALITVPLPLISSSLVVIRITEPVLPPLFKLPSEATVCGKA